MTLPTKSHALALTLAAGLALAASTARADNVTDLFNTGVNAAGNVLPDPTSPDPHYTIVNGGDGSVAIATLVPPASASPPYVAPNTTSAWIQAVSQSTL